jgi:putative ABC transport system permease protein
MKPSIIKSVAKSTLLSWKQGVVQVLLIVLLSSLITGSLLTGYSVHKSLASSMDEKLGNTDLVISSGLRYFDPGLAKRLGLETNDKVIAVTESEGFCQNFATSATALNCTVYGIDSCFFSFQDLGSLKLAEGTAAINKALATALGISAGDQIIVRLQESDPIPANAPFSPSAQDPESQVLTVSGILDGPEGGNFSSKISQALPLNIFINAAALKSGQGVARANRLYIKNSASLSTAGIISKLNKIIGLNDLGLKLRVPDRRGETEMISDRIFIDGNIAGIAGRKFPEARPVLTYLANSITLKDKTTPYSFISAVHANMVSIRDNKSIVLNSWLASDLSAAPGDTVTVSWFVPGTNNSLIEKSGSFIVERILDINDPVMDPSLMPDFPGIAKSTTCSGWDAGIPIMMSRIRQKDEAYWNKYRGTPKAFISYEEGAKLWGNQYGAATSIRFPEGTTADSIKEGLQSSFDPESCGFMISDIRTMAGNAASQGVDFGTLFLGLGFFIIVACMILLGIAQVNFFERRKKQVRTYYILGFRNKQITKALLFETGLFGIAGAVIGTAAGILINGILTAALNSVWQGAVMTNTLKMAIGPAPVLTGFISAFAISIIVSWIQVRKFLKKQMAGGAIIPLKRSIKTNSLFAAGLILGGSFLALAAHLVQKDATLIYYLAGTILFSGMIFLIRTYYILPLRSQTIPGAGFSSKRLNALYPGHATTPAIIIAAGLFAVVITAANNLTINDNDLKPEGGTGAYLLWAESAMPVRVNLESSDGKKAFGLDEKELRGMQISQCAIVKGDDASCLNLNHVLKPSLLAVDPSEFIKRGSFSFASGLKQGKIKNTWELLDESPGKNIIYGLADQSVLEWSLKLKTGDTLKYRAESGEELNIVICGALKSSVFQGYVLIGRKQLEQYFPSTPGNSIFLIDGQRESKDIYRIAITERFSNYGMSVTGAGDKLASFFTVTNTYLEVFTIMGIFGMVLGIAGLGLVLILNFTRRKREFALMTATGYSMKQIRRILFREYSVILVFGISTGVIPALVSTMGSLGQRSSFPILKMIIVLLVLLITGIIVLYITTSKIGSGSLSEELKKE